MKQQKPSTGPRQNLSSYFNEQVDQQLFGEEEMYEDLNDNYEVGDKQHNPKQVNEKHISKPSVITNQKGRGFTNTHILQHFYNPSEESDDEEKPPRQTKPNKLQTGSHTMTTTHPKNNQPQSTKQKKHSQPKQLHQIDPPQFPIYPNPYQFFPFYPPFYSPYSASGMTEDTIKEQQFKNNDTFVTDKSVESSIFFEKDKNIEVLLAESREMKQIIQCQSETIEIILKKLEEVCNKVDSFKECFHSSEKQNIPDYEQEPQPREPPLNTSNNFYIQNSSKNSSVTIPSLSVKNNVTNPSTKFSNISNPHLNESMTNNMSSLNPTKVQNSSSLQEKSSSRSDSHNSNRYSIISPTISNSPQRPTNSQSSRLNSSQTSKRSINHSQNVSTISANSEKSQSFEKPLRSPLYSSSSLKDFGSPVKSSNSEKQKRAGNSEESFLNASHLSESLDLLGDTHGDDSFVYNASYMSSYSSSHLEPFSTEMQKYVKEKILVGDLSKKEDVAKDSENTFVTSGSKRKKDTPLSYSSSSFPIKSFSKI